MKFIKLSEEDLKQLYEGFSVYKISENEEIKIQIEKIDESKLPTYEEGI